ncbi:hypothetical protein TYRP_005685 [Tyrophagus putrescentiae]|nr:hypothetical protein TYRP_005685 [Tyrophagus putrescentiae]
MASSSSQKYLLIDLYSEEEASGAGVETVGNEYEEVLVNFEEQALLLESTSIENSNLESLLLKIDQHFFVLVAYSFDASSTGLFF